MKSSNPISFHKAFSHIYVEKDVYHTERVKDILKHFPQASIILIDDYRHVFNRSHQSNAMQFHSQNLILAKKKDQMIYHGSPVCQAFDERFFYYCSCVMNCVYDCEYCFLKGMYTSANIVLFVNLEDMFKEIEKMLDEHPMYICVSYDSDLLALEPIIHYGYLWSQFTKEHENLKIEIRTKGTMSDTWLQMIPSDRTILAFTLSPYEMIQSIEHKTPNLSIRISMMKRALNAGFPIRVCLDPMMTIRDWKNKYIELIEIIDREIGFQNVQDISIGTFRLSKNYMSRMRKQYPNSSILQYPYICVSGFYQLPTDVRIETETYIKDILIRHGVEEEKIFLWNEN